MRNSSVTEPPESYLMNAGDGSYSYNKNSYFQRAATSTAKEKIDEAIATVLDIKRFSSGPRASFTIADLGCSVGPNTFIAVQNIIEAVRHKYGSQVPDFQVFFNDHTANDFNALFASLPPERNYYAAGVPGSFHGQLFPESSLHFVHSSYAIHWLSRVPKELLDEGSPAWNKGKIHYTSTPKEVGDAYKSQFTKDMRDFFNARVQEIVSGGIMAFIVPGTQDGVPHSQVPLGVNLDILGLSLMDMAKEGIIKESDVDSLNLPIYTATPQEMTELVNTNGCFDIERMELTASRSKIRGSINAQAWMMHLRAGLEGIISKHFGTEIIDELFDRFLQKVAGRLEWSFQEITQLLVVLKRK
ncbi:loganic acid O-methyltransferase-like isoform X1 [Punica granatum]|uniref:Loganic acid O-methyltransferase-like isoform X1 n=1 Tax=Punica granatum TaxID=22663 RepID=A0A6P8C6B6_PUNGR|nr:loganic acid O-methyltransferase-like isoform X1 [Punica granatum]